MQKNFTKLIAHFLSAKRYTVPAGALFLLLAASLYALATVGVATTATTPLTISADIAKNTGGSFVSQFTSLGTISITEGNNNDFEGGNTIEINAPAGWEFNLSGTHPYGISVVGREVANKSKLLNTSITSINTSKISFTYSGAVSNKIEELLINGLSIRASDGASAPEIVYVTVNSTTAISGLPANAVQINHTNGAASKIAFGTQPSNVLTGITISPSPTVLIQDQFGNTVTSGTGADASVTVAIGTNPEGSNGVLNGTKTVAAQGGLATFSGLSIDAAGAGYTLAASTDAYGNAVSTPFAVTSTKPTLNPIANACIIEGTNGYVLTVNGTKFDRNAIGRINGLDRTTEFVNPTELKITLTADDLATAGTKQISVLNPAPESAIESEFRPIVVHPSLTKAAFTPSQEVVCSGKFVTYSGPASGFTDYAWEVQGEGASVYEASGSSATILFGLLTSGEVTLKVTATNVCGEEESRFIVVDVNPTPPATITFDTPLSFCENGFVVLEAPEAPADQDNYEYQWLLEGTAIDGANNFSYKAEASGEYSVTVTAPGTFCSSTSDAVTVVESPTITQGEVTGTTAYCQNAQATALSATVSGGGNGTKTYLWEQSVTGTDSWAPATTINSPNNEISYKPSTTSSGTIYYRRTVEENGGCISVGNPIAVAVTPAITTNEISGEQSVCSGYPVEVLTGTLVGGNPDDINYLWQVSSSGTDDWNTAPGTTENPNNEASYTPATQTVLTETTSYYRRVVTSGNCVDNSNTVAVTYTPLPVVEINAGEPVAYFCPPGVATLSATTNSPANSDYDYAWFRVAQEGETEDVPSGVGSSIFVDKDHTGEYYVIVTDDNECPARSAPIFVQTVVVNNNIVSPQDQEICFGATPGVLEGAAASPSRDNATLTYQWQESANGTNYQNVTAVSSKSKDLALGSLTSTTWYRRLAIVGDCFDVSDVVQVTVKPKLELSSDLTSDAICSGDRFIYNPASVNGTSFSWTRAKVTGIENAEASGEAGVNEALINITAEPITVTYLYTTHTTECSGTPEEVKVVVNPTPQLSNIPTDAAVCSGATFSYEPASETDGSSFSWTRAAVEGINEGAVTTPVAGDINEVLTNMTSAPIDVTYSVFTSANNCEGPAQNVVVTVNPTPTVNAIADMTYCNGASGAAIVFSGPVAGATYSWSSSANVGFGLSGTGSIPAYTATNTGSTAVTATVTVTPSASTCQGTPQSFKVTVNPTPTVNAVSDVTLCNGASGAAIAFSGPVAGATYSWSSSANVGFGLSGTGSIPAYTATNTGSTAVTATVTVTPSASTCQGPVRKFTVRVDPNQPVAFTGTIANNSTFYTGQGAVTLSATPTGGVFSSSKQGAVTLSNGVYSFNPCVAGAGKHTITYTRTTGTCKSAVSKEVTVVPSKYTVVVTTNNFPVCRGENTDYTAQVYRDIEGVIYPYMTNAQGQPLNAQGQIAADDEDPAPNPEYVNNTAYVPANTPAIIKQQAHRFFEAKVILGNGEKMNDSDGQDDKLNKFTYKWTRSNSDGSSIGNDARTRGFAGLSATDWVAVWVSPKNAGTTTCSANFNILSSRIYFSEPRGYAMSLSPVAPWCYSPTDQSNVTLTANLGDLPVGWEATNVRVDWYLKRSGVADRILRTTTGATGSTLSITEPRSTFQNGDQVYLIFTSAFDTFADADSKCTKKQNITQPITIQIDQPAAITANIAAPAAICVGESTSFIVNATGTNLTYQWYKNGAALSNVNGITGATAATLNVTNATTASGGNYYVVVKNAISSACSAVATSNQVALVINPLPIVNVSSPVTCAGTATTVTANATGGTGPYTYTWTVLPNGVPNPGDAASINTTVAGTYTAMVTDAKSCKSVVASHIVSFNELPTAQTVTTPNGTSYCAGGSGVPVGLASSQSGVVYTLRNSTTNATVATVTGTGAAVNFPADIPAGTYTVTATNSTTNCPSSFGNVTITETQLPTAYNVTGGGSFCAGGFGVPVGLNDSDQGMSYQLQRTFSGVTSNVGTAVAGTGNELNFGLQTDPGIYTVLGTTVAGSTTATCPLEMAGSVSVIVNKLEVAAGEILVSDSAGEPITDTNPIMPGSSITITTNDDITNAGAGMSYIWYIGNETTGTWGEPITTKTNELIIEDVKPGEFDVKVVISPNNNGTNCFEDLLLVTASPLVPLPVEIIYLNASKQGNDVLLEWATAMEEDNAGFEVQVSTDGFSYRKLTFVPAKNGNSNMKQVYAFTDRENGKFGTRYYRLKQLDTYGTFEFFGPKAVTFGSVASKVIAFPNPFHDEVTLDIAAEVDGEALITVTDAVGKKLLERKVQVEKGFTTEKLRLDAGLPIGLYIIKVQVGGFTQYIKMIKE